MKTLRKVSPLPGLEEATVFDLLGCAAVLVVCWLACPWAYDWLQREGAWAWLVHHVPRSASFAPVGPFAGNPYGGFWFLFEPMKRMLWVAVPLYGLAVAVHIARAGARWLRRHRPAGPAGKVH